MYVGLDVDLPHLAARGDRRPELVALRERADVLQARVGADRARLLAHELHAVVVRRIVARRDHDAAVELAAERREIGELRAADADVEHVDAGVREALDERRRERRARGANVAADGDGARLHERRVAAADAIRDVLVELLGNAAANVVRFEASDLLHRVTQIARGAPERNDASLAFSSVTTLSHLWLPYRQMKTAPPPLVVERTDGVRLYLADGRELIDGIASWWTACHGYNHPHIRAAVAAQLERMPHVMLGGLVHAPADVVGGAARGVVARRSRARVLHGVGLGLRRGRDEDRAAISLQSRRAGRARGS